MEEPEVIQKPEEIHPLSKEISHLIDTYIGSIEDAKKPSTPIHIDEIASRIAKFYEMIRKVIDWKEDSVLRRSAIERALKLVSQEKKVLIPIELPIPLPLI